MFMCLYDTFSGFEYNWLYNIPIFQLTTTRYTRNNYKNLFYSFRRNHLFYRNEKHNLLCCVMCIKIVFESVLDIYVLIKVLRG